MAACAIVDYEREGTNLHPSKGPQMFCASQHTPFHEMNERHLFLLSTSIPWCLSVEAPWPSQNWLRSNESHCSESLGPRNNFPSLWNSTSARHWYQLQPWESEFAPSRVWDGGRTPLKLFIDHKSLINECVMVMWFMTHPECMCLTCSLYNHCIASCLDW